MAKEEKKRKRNHKKIDEKIVEDKKTKNHFEMWEVVIIMVITTLLGLFIGSYVVYKKYNNSSIKCNKVDSGVNSIISVYEGLVKEYYGEIDEDKLADYAIYGMLQGLGDPYAEYISKDNSIQMDEELNGMYIGLGVEVSNDNNNVRIVSMANDSPAAKSGIQVGDIIVSCDGKKVSYDVLNDFIKGIKTSKVGDKKVIEVLRNGESIRYTIALDVIELKSVYSNLESNIGFITISNFANNTYSQFVEEYEKLKESNIKGLVIDLRGNHGGYTNSAYSIASMFLNKDDVIFVKTDGSKIEKVVNEYEKVIDMPLVILIDGYTASSAEILVASLKDNIDVTLVGTKTYGKGTVQKIESIGEGRYIKYTTQEWLTPKGKKVNGVGITPDVIVPIDDLLDYDVQYNKAMEIIKNKIGG